MLNSFLFVSIRGNWRRSPGLQVGTKWNETGLSKCDEMCRKCVEMRRNESFPGAADLHGNRERNFNEMQRNRSIQAQNRTTGRYFRRCYTLYPPAQRAPCHKFGNNFSMWIENAPLKQSFNIYGLNHAQGFKVLQPRGNAATTRATPAHSQRTAQKSLCLCVNLRRNGLYFLIGAINVCKHLRVCYCNLCTTCTRQL